MPNGSSTPWKRDCCWRKIRRLPAMVIFDELQQNPAELTQSLLLRRGARQHRSPGPFSTLRGGRRCAGAITSPITTTALTWRKHFGRLDEIYEQRRNGHRKTNSKKWSMKTPPRPRCAGEILSVGRIVSPFAQDGQVPSRHWTASSRSHRRSPLLTQFTFCRRICIWRKGNLSGALHRAR